MSPIFGKYGPNKSFDIPDSDLIRQIRIRSDNESDTITNIMFVKQDNQIYEFKGSD